MTLRYKATDLPISRFLSEMYSPWNLEIGKEFPVQQVNLSEMAQAEARRLSYVENRKVYLNSYKNRILELYGDAIQVEKNISTIVDFLTEKYSFFDKKKAGTPDYEKELDTMSILNNCTQIVDKIFCIEFVNDFVSVIGAIARLEKHKKIISDRFLLCDNPGKMLFESMKETEYDPSVNYIVFGVEIPSENIFQKVNDCYNFENLFEEIVPIPISYEVFIQKMKMLQNIYEKYQLPPVSEIPVSKKAIRKQKKEELIQSKKISQFKLAKSIESREYFDKIRKQKEMENAKELENVCIIR